MKRLIALGAAMLVLVAAGCSGSEARISSEVVKAREVRHCDDVVAADIAVCDQPASAAAALRKASLFGDVQAVQGLDRAVPWARRVRVSVRRAS